VQWLPVLYQNVVVVVVMLASQGNAPTYNIYFLLLFDILCPAKSRLLGGNLIL
jgi:hypothetical protein